MKFHSPKNVRHQRSRCARLFVMVFGVCSCVGLIGLIGCGTAEPEPSDDGASATADRIEAGPADKVRATFQNVDPE